MVKTQLTELIGSWKEDLDAWLEVPAGLVIRDH